MGGSGDGREKSEVCVCGGGTTHHGDVRLDFRHVAEHGRDEAR